MIRDSKFSRRNSGKNLNFDEPENVPVNSNIREQSFSRMSIDSCSRPPLNAIQEPLLNPSKNDQEQGFKTPKILRTPTKPKVMKTPEKQGGLGRNRYGWGPDSGNVSCNVNTTPKACRALGTGRGSSGFIESGSTHSTPTKSVSVSKPPNPGLVYGGCTRPPVVGGARGSNFAALSKGVPVSYNTYTNVNSVEVPHFDLKEDPSFWMDHNVQVLIRVRPLNGMEISSQGYNRCLKQESAQSLTWVGHPETRFTFDHVACETIDQETLFKMVGQPMVENCLSGYNSCMFAYGQTGSGKTHTMLGEINDLEVKPSQYRGMTPRIFEFLFARIIAEEESRKDERLVYTCKCSFLEIYNEQIADLLDPSSTNLQLREDVKKGVYVENLTEFEVHTVGDILKLLSQGSANRRVAATNMNRESSRSHSVFTCVIESRWEKDSTSNLRFARLNLVDLAGSERQKSSGAEGERLKEAANINKSLSTLGHVIMVLVDGANARTKHVPYRDSRLTFLLQDSLGGNSKTMIIANVSPSMSSAIETLNTLKFAQRAKLIQNNAVINEDASGDVAALQHQIRLLKEELAILKRHNIARSLRFSSKDESYSNGSSVETNLSKDDSVVGDDQILRLSCKQLKSLETSLNGALRREQSSENCIRKLEEEIEQLNSLVHQREEENRCTKMMLKFREDKISRMESLVAGLMPVDSYLLEENNTLREEIQISRAKVDWNPEVTRFAVENLRLSEQLERVQDYKKGEREMLLTEVSELRDQLALLLEENLRQDTIMNSNMEKEAAAVKKENESLQLELQASHGELQKCRDNLNSYLEKNEKLSREIVDLTALLETQKSAVNERDGNTEVRKESKLEFSSNADQSSEKKDTEVVDLQLEAEILKIMLQEERSIRGETEEKFSLITKQFEKLREELHEAKSVIEALECQQLASINELEDLRNTNKKYDEILHKKEPKIVSVNRFENQDSSLQAKLNKVQDSLDKTKKLNMWYQTDRACHASNEEEMDEVRKQVEAEMTDVIVCLQEEICGFQSQMHESILKEKETKHELALLQQKCEEKDKNFNSLFEEVEEVLTAGHKALDEANMIGTGKRTWVSDQLQNIARNISEKELRIDELNSCLEDAKSRGNEMESMLRSLRGATLVMSEAHQQDCREKDQEIHHLLSLISQLEDQIKLYELEVMDAKVNAAHQEVESLCYFDKFVEAQLNVKEAGFMINNLMAENEELKSLEERLVTDLSAKEIELFIMLSKIEHVALEYNDLKKENTHMATVIEKFKEELIMSLVDMHLKDWISLEKDAEVCLLQKQVAMQVEALKMAHTLAEENEAVTENKKLYELELLDAKQKAAQHAVESSCYLAKFLETQRNTKETFSMINKLATENEAMKSKEVALINERDMFKGSYLVLEKQLETDTIKMKKEVEELELMILEIQGTVDEELRQTGSDLVEIKSRFQSSNKLQRTTCEEIWSEIIAKDWAMSVLHMCHMGILIDTVTGLNAEKSLLYHGLCESNSLVSQLNDNSRKELEACSMLRGKLLADIKNSYDRVLRKEDEADKLSIKMTSFEEKILDLQLMEEAMLERSGHMGHELSMLLKEVMDDKDEQLRCLSAKEFELITMSSKLEQVALENNDLQNENIHMSTVLEKFKEEIIISHVDSSFKDFVLMEKDANFGLLQNQIKMQEEALINSSDSISALEYKNQMLEISSCKLQHELEIKGAELVDAIKHKEDDIVEFETSFEALACELYENIVKSAVLEAQLKEKAALISTLEADLFKQHQSTESLSSEIHLLTENAEDALRAKVLAEVQLVETKKAMESLEIEILEFKTALGEKNTLIESLKEDLESVICERNEAIASQSNFYAEEKLKLYEKSVEGLESTLNEYETSQHYAEEKLKLNQKSMEGLECTVNELENQVEMVKGEAESQRLQREELEQELQKIRLQEQSLTTENETFKAEIANYKMKVIELEDEIKKLPGQQILEQQIHHLEIIREENKVLKARNDEISSKLRKAEIMISRVNQGFANRRAELVRRSTS